jgi:hypothetical protein
MATARQKIPESTRQFPTAGYGSVAPPWIKADLIAEQAARRQTESPAIRPANQHALTWLWRQLGWR